MFLIKSFKAGNIANGYNSKNVNVYIEGYVPISIAGYGTGNVGAKTCGINIKDSGTSVKVNVQVDSAGSFGDVIYFNVLYVKADFFKL